MDAIGEVMEPEIIRSIVLQDSHGNRHNGRLLRYFHWDEAGTNSALRPHWEANRCLRVKLDDFDVIGEQTPRAESHFHFQGIGFLTEAAPQL
jgi:hypothetical protein